MSAIDLTGDDLSTQSNAIFNDLVDLIWSGCDNEDTDNVSLCNVTTLPMVMIQDCINETSIFSGILTPDKIFRGDPVSQEQISITTALMDSVLASSSLTCTDIQRPFIIYFLYWRILSQRIFLRLEMILQQF